MNRTDRLFGILLLLQRRRRLRAHDLAEEFEVSVRTIYRDIDALSQTGVPIVSLPGQGYELLPGFYMPPLVFTPGEAAALSLGARLLANQAAGHIPVDAEHALAKIGATLPDEARERVDRLAEVIQFVTSQARFDLDDPRLVALQRAVERRWVVYLRYHGRERDEVTEREVEPRGLTYADGTWYLSGYCRLRHADRTFRLDRIDELHVTPHSFEPRSRPEPMAEKLEVRVRFSPEVIRWARERQHYGFEREEDVPGPGAVMVYRVDVLSELVPWLRAWGPDAEVLGPPELRDAMRREAIKLVEMLT